ncbi:MAG TPA: aspartyl/asparaginyl beta-hydroxylase domain-containing protein [Allosphingosinicella sp.]|nr:aspartyl/asparaginyl beta-hydroxylase domain-containing protein [Allosphingosinicella sp.]
MARSAAEAEAMIRSAVAALQSGDAGEAMRLLRSAVEAGTVPPPWFLVAQACRHGGDEAGEKAALDNLLEEQPRHLGGLIMRADCHLRSGDRRAAASFYTTALAAAAGQERISPMMANELRRAEAAAAELEREFAGHLEKQLGDCFAGAPLAGRVAAAVDLMLGRKQVFLQQPTAFYFPGLPQIEFYEREQFPWLAQVEAAIPQMRAELEAVLADDGAFVPYVEGDPNRPQAVHRLLGDPSWGAFHLWKQGAPVPGNAERCPRTMAALLHAPMPRISGRSPMALFSLLRPGAHIAPHNGMLNTRLICHIPLIVPGRCRLRVGNEVREWEEGKALIFDDTIEHEAWNDSDSTRVILLFEIWRPELSEAERVQLTALFEAVELYGGGGEA